MPVVTALYAGMLGLMAVAIAFAAGRARGQTGITLGDGGNPQMLAAMRRHANFIEFVPLCLILIGLVEMGGAPPVAVHALGGGLVVFRACHALGFKAEGGNAGRGIGAAGSTLVLVVASIWAIVLFF